MSKSYREMGGRMFHPEDPVCAKSLRETNLVVLRDSGSEELGLDFGFWVFVQQFYDFLQVIRFLWVSLASAETWGANDPSLQSFPGD